MSTPMPNKDYVICVEGEGLEVTKLTSVQARGLFAASIQDVEFLRESLVEAAQYDGTTGFYQLDKLAQSLDWKGRGLPPNTTTLEVFKSYVDDRPNRRIERWLSLNTMGPLVGDKQSDMKFADSLSTSLPWIVDRFSRESSWWKYHQNGRSEGRFKEPFRFDNFYTAGWFVMYSNLQMYYPPMTVFGEGLPFNMDEVVSENFTAHETAYFKPATPENNPNREALFSAPYPDDAQLGKSLISSIAPVYFTGNFSGFTYDDTFMGVVGMDIAVDSISSFLDALQGTVSPTSFSMLVDTNFNTIVISSNTTARIYPERTGMERERVTYDPAGNIVKDRRNATYLPSDTFLQDLTKLPSANWMTLLETIRNEKGGRDEYTTLNITFTGETEPREFYVWYDRWEYVAKWYLLVFAPKDEVDTAAQVEAGPRTMSMTNSDDTSQVIFLEAIKGYSMTGQGIIVNSGRIDMYLRPKNIPEWATLMNTAASRDTDSDSYGDGDGDTTTKSQWPYLLKAGKSLPIDFQVATQSLSIGIKTDYLVFQLQDAGYPNCNQNSDVALAFSIRVNAQNCTDAAKVLNDGICVCSAGTIGIADSCVNVTVLTCSIVFPLFAVIIAAVYFHGLAGRKRADAIWEVKPSELKIGSNPVVLGEGSFGLVVLADYRGTLVAVKKALPSTRARRGSNGGKNLRTSDPFQSVAVQRVSRASQVKTVLTEIQEEDDEYKDVEGAQENESTWFRRPSFDEKVPTLRSVGKGRQEDSGFFRRSRVTERHSTLRITDYKLRQEFINEMRLVAKLRHPCIITGNILSACGFCAYYTKYFSLHSSLPPKNESPYLFSHGSCRRPKGGASARNGIHGKW
jgi:hypothetical protein